MKALPFALAAASLLLAGCNEPAANKPAAPTQVVVQVNDSELSVHQLNQLLEKTQGLSAEQVQDARKRMLQTLIDQQLLMDQAVEEKLDRSPDVLLALEKARREVLSRAYLEKAAATAEAPSEQEIDGFYDRNPNLFALRNLYHYRELLLPAQTANFAELAEALRSATSLQAARDLLAARGVEPRLNQGQRAAEQSPPELLERLAMAKPGELLVVDNNLGLSLLEITRIEPAPLQREQARPIIANLLLGQRRNQAMAQAVGKLRQSAELTYTDKSLQPL